MSDGIDLALVSILLEYEIELSISAAVFGVGCVTAWFVIVFKVEQKLIDAEDLLKGPE
jgi:hypothetical protein